MNIVQMHEVVRFWLDVARSPRVDPETIDMALNTVIDKIVDEKYTYLSAFHTYDTFQKTQKVRDQLGKLVKRLKVNSGIEIQENERQGESTIVITNPGSYRHMVYLEVFHSPGGSADPIRYECVPIDYNRKGTIQTNPFRKPRISMFPKLYHIEEEGKIVILHPAGLNLTDADMFIIKKPVLVKYGFEFDQDKTFAEGDNLIVAEKATEYNGGLYNIGDEITIGINTSITSGLVVRNFVNSELSITLDQEITGRAAVEILRSTGSADKVNMLLAEFKVG